MANIIMPNRTLHNQNSAPQSTESRIARTSSYLRFGTGFLLLLHVLMLVLLIAWLIWSPTATDDVGLIKELKLSDGNVKFDVDLMSQTLSMNAKWIIFTVCAILGMYTAYCISRLHRVFGNFNNKEIFTQRNSRLLRHLGYALIVGIIFFKLVGYGVLIVAGLLDSSGFMDTTITLSINTNFILKVLVIGMVFLFAWVLDIGRELYTDAKFTI